MTAGDVIRAGDGLGVMAELGPADGVAWRPVLRLDKFTADQVADVRALLGLWREPTGDELLAHVTPDETLVCPGNLLTTAGLQRITNLIIGAGGQAATATAARIGVGNSSAAEAVGQTDLQAAAGAANRYFMPMDATYPTAVNGVLTFRSTFASADGNFVWAEWCIDIGAPVVAAGAVVNATMLNRKVQALGTKASGSWVATATITLA